jgi:hypothetical protein
LRCAPTQAICDFPPDTTISARLIIETPFKHAEDDVVVSCDKASHFRTLAISQAFAIRLPLVADISRQAREHSMYAGI